VRFRLLDRVDLLEPRARAVGRKALSFEEYTLERPHYSVGTLPGTLLLEAVAQLGTWLVLASTDFRRAPLVVTIDRAELVSPLAMGEVAALEVRVRSFHDDAARLDGVARVAGEGGRELARIAGVGCTLVDAALLHDVAAARVELEALCGRYPGPR
jgi:3-hydroxyacyl-[acyl-carrier-protein] dehydratase